MQSEHMKCPNFDAEKCPRTCPHWGKHDWVPNMGGEGCHGSGICKRGQEYVGGWCMRIVK